MEKGLVLPTPVSGFCAMSSVIRSSAAFRTFPSLIVPFLTVDFNNCVSMSRIAFTACLASPSPSHFIAELALHRCTYS